MAVETVEEAKAKGPSKGRMYAAIAVVAIVALVAGWFLGGGAKVKQEVAYLVGMEEYVYGYPLVMMDVTR